MFSKLHLLADTLQVAQAQLTRCVSKLKVLKPSDKFSFFASSEGYDIVQ